MNEKIYLQLESIVGKDNVFREIADRTRYSEDESHVKGIVPQAVLRPQNHQQLIELIRLANEYKFAVVPRGGGTGLAGGAVPIAPGIVISSELLNSIIDIDTGSMTAIVQAGVINSKLQAAADELNMFYPVNPASMDSCTLGGNLAQSTGGANTVRFGTTKNYITGIRAITGEGLEWNAGGRIVKNSTDATLINLMSGSEGILSFFHELTFRLLPKPVYSAWIIALYKDIIDIPRTVGLLFSRGHRPTMMELMDSKTLKLCSKHLKKEIRYSDLNQLLIRFDYDDKEYLEKTCFEFGEYCMETGAEDVIIADSAREKDVLWEIRSNIHEAIENNAESFCEEDIVVPVNRIAELIRKIQILTSNNNCQEILFGHLGDGNIHVNLIRNDDGKPEVEAVERIRNNLFEIGIALGGKPSGEHGIGLSKKKYFNSYVDPVYIEMLKKIKRQFDPNLILNPGKIIDL
ncbi:FAD-binding oxidoreductase [Elusimicrobiota bacterium]